MNNLLVQSFSLLISVEFSFSTTETLNSKQISCGDFYRHTHRQEFQSIYIHFWLKNAIGILANENTFSRKSQLVIFSSLSAHQLIIETMLSFECHWLHSSMYIYVCVYVVCNIRYSYVFHFYYLLKRCQVLFESQIWCKFN